jgi:hypothetical protein
MSPRMSVIGTSATLRSAVWTSDRRGTRNAASDRGGPETADRGFAPDAFEWAKRWRCLTGEQGRRLPNGPTGRESRRVTAIEAYALTASQTRKVPNRRGPLVTLVRIWEDVPWLILALVPPLGGPGLELEGPGLLPHSQPLLILPCSLSVDEDGSGGSAPWSGRCFMECTPTAIGPPTLRSRWATAVALSASEGRPCLRYGSALKLIKKTLKRK